MDNNKILDYQFTAVPTQLMILLDVNCRSMLFTLCQLSSYYSDENGRFFRTNADLAEESRLSQKLVIATIDTLYRYGIIDVWSVGKSNGKHSNYFKLNKNRFEDFEKLSMDDLKNPEYQIEMVNYREKGYTPSYLMKDEVDVIISLPIATAQVDELSITENEEYVSTNDLPDVISKIPQCTNNIYNIENTDNLENEDNINNKEIEESTNNRENRENREDNILNNSVEEMEEHWFNIVSERVKNGERMVDILEDLAKNDWNCYQFTKKTIKDKCFKAYSDSRDLFRYLNRKYGPADEYFDVV